MSGLCALYRGNLNYTADHQSLILPPRYRGENLIDIEAVRTDTPGCSNVIHLHNSGSSLMPRPVVDAVIEHLQLEASIGGYEAEARRGDRVKSVYRAIAGMLNCETSEVALTESATVAWARCYLAIAATMKPDMRVLTARAEYASNYITMMQSERQFGIKVEIVSDDSFGQLDVKALEDMIGSDVGMVCVTHVPTSGGLVNPAAAIGAITRAQGIPFLLDACQSVGQMPLDVEALGVDALSGTGRKYLRGPRGTGFLYISNRLSNRIEPPALDLHGAQWSSLTDYTVCDGARRFEWFESSIASRLGFGVAVEYAMRVGLENIWERIVMLADYSRQALSDIDGVEVRDTGAIRSGIVTFTDTRIEPAKLVSFLRRNGVNIGQSEARSTRIDLQGRGIDTLLRAPVHYFNTTDELDRFIELLRQAPAKKE